MASRLKDLLRDPATRFVARALAWFLFLLGALRLSWIQTYLLVPFAGLQARAAAALLGKSELGVIVDTSCSGSDALAVCLGAILAYPVTWRRRLIAAGGGFGVITAVNTVRLGSLSQVVGNRPLFDLLHRQVWPALIILAAAAYAFWWMRRVTAPAGEARTDPRPPLGSLPMLPFFTLSLVFVAAYYAFYDLLLRSRLLGAAAQGAATTAGGLMTFCGVPARVDGGTLQTGSGAWIVTPECVTTPLIPLFLAAVLVTPKPWWTRLLLLAVTPALFFLLGIGRLMVLALPAQLIGSPAVAVHAFYQLLIAVIGVAWWARRSGPDLAARRSLRALGLGAAIGFAFGLLDLRVIRPAIEKLGPGAHLGHGSSDPQGVLLLLPGFVLGLVAALWMVRGRPGGGKALTGASCVVAIAGALLVVGLGELEVHTEMAFPVVLLRLVSLALPAVVAATFGWIGDRQRPSAAKLSHAASPAA